MTATTYDEILADIIATLNEARSAAARSVNTVMTATYWRIGHHIVEHEQLGHDRAQYGETLLERLAADLTLRFGRGLGVRNLYLMRQFRLAWAPERILQTASAESLRGPALPIQLARQGARTPSLTTSGRSTRSRIR